MTATTLQVAAPARAGLLVKVADRFGVDPAKMMETLKATAFKVKDQTVTNEQMMALLIVADQYGLNPFTKEIYAFPDKGGIVPVVGVDGWARIVNSHPQIDGIDFEFADDASWCACIIKRKDRSHPIRVTEYMAECKRPTQPWTSHPRRMLRHKALIQCARLAFGFAGIFDPDEAERVAENADTTPRRQSGSLTQVRAALAKPATFIDMETGEVQAREQRPEPQAEKPEPASDPVQRPAAWTYAQHADAVLKAADQEIAALALDAARELPPDQYDELVAVYGTKWGN